MNKIVLIIVALLFFCSVENIEAQIPENKTGPVGNVKKDKAKDGTFQLIYHHSKLKYVFATEILIEIENQRDKKEVKYLWLTPTVEVMILPKEFIESTAFKPLPEIKYVD